MTLPPTHITVTRLRPSQEQMAIAPLLARHPQAHPERIVAISGTVMLHDEAQIIIDYANGARLLGSVTVDGEGDWHTSAVRFDTGTQGLNLGPLYDDLPLDAVLPLVGEIGRGVLEPEWLDD